MIDSDVEIDNKQIVKPLAIFDSNDDNQQESTNEKNKQRLNIIEQDDVSENKICK